MGALEGVLTADRLRGLRVGLGFTILFGPIYASTAWARGPFSGPFDLSTTWLDSLLIGMAVWAIVWVPLGVVSGSHLGSGRTRRLLFAQLAAYPFVCVWSYSSVLEKTGNILPMVVGTARPPWFNWLVVELAAEYGLLASIVVLAVGIGLADRVLGANRRAGVCAKCGYSQLGIWGEVCPECGAGAG